MELVEQPVDEVVEHLPDPVMVLTPTSGQNRRIVGFALQAANAPARGLGRSTLEGLVAKWLQPTAEPGLFAVACRVVETGAPQQAVVGAWAGPPPGLPTAVHLGKAGDGVALMWRLPRIEDAADRRLAAIVESCDDAIIGKTLDGVVTSWNQAAERVFGYRAEEMLGKSVSLLVPPERTEELRATLEQIARGQRVDHLETMRVAKDGRRLAVSLTVSPIRDRSGMIVGASGISRDVTAHRGAEDKFRALLEAAPDAMVIVDSQGLISLVNRQTERLFGYRREQLLGQPIEILVPERLHDVHLGHRGGYLADPGVREMGAGLQLYGRRNDGTEFPVEISLSPLVTEQGTLVSAAVRDITGRKQAEEQFRGLLESAPDAMVIVDTDGRITLLNRQTERLFGYQRDELLGQPIETLVPERFRRVHLGHRGGYLADPGVREMGAGLQLYGRRNDGTEFPVEISLSPLVTDQGTLASAAVRDITSRKQAELALEEAKLAAEQANKAKSDYLSRMSHELRTPLNAILGFAQVLELEQLSSDQRDSLSHILSGAEHLLGLINEVLDIAAIEADRLPLSLEPVSVAEITADAVSLIRPLADQHAIVLAVPQQPCDLHVLGDRQRLKQVLLNLLSNAVKYNRAGGSVRLDYQPIDDQRLRIAVTDSGPGITPEQLELLFVPFERLGSEQTGIEGSGLGLPLSKRLTEAMGGTLQMATTVGKGSTFYVELPLADSPLRHAGSQPDAPAPEQQSGPAPVALSVLYIEDNLSNLQLVERVVGYRPGIRLISAMRPQLGLELAAQHQPDLVLLDLHLPDLSGTEVLRRLRADPTTAGIPVVVLTADARPGLRDRLLDHGARAMLTKPLNVKELLGVLDAIADERARAVAAPATSTEG